MFSVLIALIVAYLVGSIPTGLLVGRAAAGIDLREHGSGNIGATNAFRVLGKKLGSFVLFCDFLKGLAPVAILPVVLGLARGGSTEELLIGAAAITGHMFPAFTSFVGGKGVATALGVFTALVPGQIFIVLVIGLILIGLTGYVSVGSITGAILLPIVLYFSNASGAVCVVGTLAAAVVLMRHHANLDRIMAGRELRFWDSIPEDDEAIAGTSSPGRE